MPPIPEVKPLPEPPKYDDAQREEDAARKRARLRNQRPEDHQLFLLELMA